MIKNFAHRGFSGSYPENTILAFRKAMETGCDGIELDVHFSKDKEVVIIHDEMLKRTTGISGLVSDFTLEELKKMDASYGFCKGRFNHEEWPRSECGIPTLKEYFELIKDTELLTNIELKTGVNPYPGIEEKVLEIIDQYHMRERVIISSFNHYSVLKMKKMAPDMTYGFLEESWLIDAAQYTKRQAVACMHPCLYAVTKDYVKQAKENDLKINVWTVNTEEEMVDMIHKGVDGIIGNYPDLCKRVLREYQ